MSRLRNAIGLLPLVQSMFAAALYSYVERPLNAIPLHSQASDDNGIGQTSVISLRISLLDANDSPPVCESPLYRASLDEGASTFDPPLIIRARDPDAVSQMSYRYVWRVARPIPPSIRTSFNAMTLNLQDCSFDWRRRHHRHPQ